MSRAVMQQALEALENDPVPLNAINNACFFLRQALAEPEQPVAWMCPDDPDRATAFSWSYGYCIDCGKPLTDEECDSVLLALDEWARDLDQYDYGLPLHNEELREKAREVIRAAHGITGESK